MTDNLLERLASAIGTQYEIENEIGRGGMSVVYGARDRRLNRRVAIKVLPPELAFDEAIRTRFTREAQTAAQLAHPHIVPIYDVGEHEGLAWLIMAFIDGGSLARLLAREPRQPLDEVRRLTAEIADALAYAHVRGIVHRDIKPDNVLIDSASGRAMVTDFGIARALEAGSRLTNTGVAVGTPAYMSPEQAMGEKEVDGRADIYSLGILSYQMVTGRVPFTSANSMSLLLKHVTEKPRPIAELRPETPGALAEAIERALAKDPDDRWPGASALRDALRADGSPVAPWRAEQREPVRYNSPRPPSRKRSGQTGAATGSPASVQAHRPGPDFVPLHLADLTQQQRADLRIWNGRVTLAERVSNMRVHSAVTFISIFAGLGALAGVPDVPPLILSPLVPAYLTIKWRRKARSLRETGIRVRDALLALTTSRALRSEPRVKMKGESIKGCSPEVLNGPHGQAIRRAAEDRAAIQSAVKALPKGQRAMIPDVVPTANALLERTIALATLYHGLDRNATSGEVAQVKRQIIEAEQQPSTPERDRRLILMRRQRESLVSIQDRRNELAGQISNAVLALSNLRLDLVRVRSTGLESGLAGITSATQEARALSRDIEMVLAAAEEVRDL